MSAALLALLVVAAVAAFSLVLHAVLVAPQQLSVSEHEVPIADLPAAFEGYTVAVLSDVHAAPYGAHDQTRRAVAVANAAAPDLVVLLGDYCASLGTSPRVSARFYETTMPRVGQLLATLRARDGMVAVLGNHDHYYDGDRVAGWLDTLGARVLVNAHVVLARGGAALVVGGVDDWTESDTDPSAGCNGAPDAPTVELAHNPGSVLGFTAPRRVDIVLSGHTHGGQIVLPWYGALATFAKVCTRSHPAGWVPNQRAPLLVSRGVGGDIPLRFNCPPEVLVVRLVRGEGPPRLVRQWSLRGARWWRRAGGGRRAAEAQQPA